MRILDIDGDGIPDLVVAANESDNEVGRTYWAVLRGELP
jgi:hypothetical protein